LSVPDDGYSSVILFDIINIKETALIY
jgi:hypothetical protein